MATVGNLQHKLTAHTGDVTGLAFSSKILATCSGDKTLRLWSAIDFNELPHSPICEHKYIIHCVTFSPFGSQLATSSLDGRAIVWDSRTGQIVASFEHKSKNGIRVCRFSPDSKMLATGCDDDTICLWDIATKQMKRQFEGHEGAITALAFSPNSVYLVSGTPDGDIRIWDAKYGHGKHLIDKREVHDLGVNACEFSPTYGCLAATEATQTHFLLATGGHDNTVKLWDLVSNSCGPAIQFRVRDILLGHSESIMCLSFTPNGKILASGSGDKTVRLWDPLKGEPVHTISGHGRYVMCCAFSTDGDWLATGSNDRTVCVWKISTEEQLTDLMEFPEEEAGKLDETGYEDIELQLHETVGRDFRRWAVEDVSKWLTEIGLSQYTDSFRKNEIDGTELLTLNDAVLGSALGISALGHRNKILRSIQHILEHPYLQPRDTDSSSPDEFLCPITRETMKDPVIASDGYTYERAAIESWIASGRTRSPMTNAPFTSTDLTPNRSLKMLIGRHQLKA